MSPETRKFITELLETCALIETQRNDAWETIRTQDTEIACLKSDLRQGDRQLAQLSLEVATLKHQIGLIDAPVST